MDSIALSGLYTYNWNDDDDGRRGMAAFKFTAPDFWGWLGRMAKANTASLPDDSVVLPSRFACSSGMLCADALHLPINECLFGSVFP